MTKAKIYNTLNTKALAFNFKSFPTKKPIHLSSDFYDHSGEGSSRLIFSFLLIATIFLFVLLNLGTILQVFQVQTFYLELFQNSLEEYFGEALKATLGLTFLVITPLLSNQFLVYLRPAFTNSEVVFFLPIYYNSLFFFYSSIAVSYFILFPFALKALSFYTALVLKPLWAFSQYCDTFLFLFYFNALIFQLPLFQLLGIFGDLTFLLNLIEFCRYCTLLCAVISAIATPSSDPLTQILLTCFFSLFYYFSLRFNISFLTD
jgi:sec-independent protein translocase protein TatC